MSHWWGESVKAFISCVLEHARLHELGEDALYWVCAYANNQHELGADLAEDPLDSSSAAARLLALLGPCCVLASRA